MHLGLEGEAHHVDVTAALTHLNAHARAKSHGQCARYVRGAVEAGGVTLIRQLSAKDYGGSLTKVGFISQGALVAGFRAGDIAVIQPIAGHPHGHICMYNGRHWVSDFKQLHGFYPSAGYRKHKAAYIIYRYPGADAGNPALEQGSAATDGVLP